MTTLRRRLGYFLTALVLTSAAGAQPAQAPAGPAPRFVVFEDFTRFT
jgi:hypothetical protein